MNASEQVIRDIVTQVLKETLCGDNCCSEGFFKQKDKSGIIKVKTDTVKCEPFEAKGVALKDILTLEEAPNMGAGVMELDHGDLEWTLTYDEYDIVLSGELEIIIDGRSVKGGPGDVIYIPKNSHIHFHTESKARYVYIAYPANWSELV